MEPEIEQYSRGQETLSAMRNHQPASGPGVSR